MSSISNQSLFDESGNSNGGDCCSDDGTHANLIQSSLVHYRLSVEQGDQCEGIRHTLNTQNLGGSGRNESNDTATEYGRDKEHFIIEFIRP